MFFIEFKVKMGSVVEMRVVENSVTNQKRIEAGDVFKSIEGQFYLLVITRSGSWLWNFGGESTFTAFQYSDREKNESEMIKYIEKNLCSGRLIHYPQSKFALTLTETQEA